MPTKIQLLPKLASMRRDDSPYRCPYPNLMFVFSILAYFLTMIVLALAWADMEVNAAAMLKLSEWKKFCELVLMAFMLSFMYGFISLTFLDKWRWRKEALYFLLLVGSVYAAVYNGGYYYGLGWMILLVFLIFPYYYNMFLSICFARKERAKFRSLVGKEGMSVRFEGQYNMVVEIDHEEFDAIPYSNGEMVIGIKTGIPVIVLGANATSIDVEEKHSPCLCAQQKM